MIDVSNMRLVANLLGTPSRPVWMTAPVGKVRQISLGDQEPDARVSRRASTGTQGGTGDQHGPSGIGAPRADVVVHLSPEAVRAARDGFSAAERSNAGADRPGALSTETSAVRTAARGDLLGQPRTTEEQEEIQDLERRDREVRQHEATHKAALGPFARGGPRFTYTTGPDGQRYAVGGEVSVDVSPVPDDPQATIRKMTTVRRAALAPQHPSAADHAVAADATRNMRAAQQELRAEQLEEQNGGNSASAPADRASAGGRAAHQAPHPGHDPFRVHQQFFGAPDDQRGRLLDIHA